MTQEEIQKAFENRWRIKTENMPAAWVKGVKDLCRDFFETGILIADGTDAATTVTTADFEQWWNLYDKKVGRDKAQKLWARLSASDKKACMAYTPLYVSATSEKRFRKNPETFLRNKSWNDEIIPNGNTANNNLSKLAAVLAP